LRTLAPNGCAAHGIRAFRRATSQVECSKRLQADDGSILAHPLRRLAVHLLRTSIGSGSEFTRIDGNESTLTLGSESTLTLGSESTLTLGSEVT
jgi:hypothetical protein